MVAYKWTVLSNTTIGSLLASINGTIILISLPAIFNGLGISWEDPSNFALLIWMLLGYGVVTATLLVTFGRISDIFGRARMYNLGFAIFAVGSILLFLVPNRGVTGGWELVGFRLVQGVGGSFLFANSSALLTDAFPAGERGKALGINQVAFIGGSVVGLVLGGVLAAVPPIPLGPLTIPTWRIVFLASVPFAIFGTLWAYWKLRETASLKKGQRIDYVGNATFGVGLILLLIAITYGLLPYGGSPMGWGSPWVIAGIVGGSLLLLAFPFIESRVPDPLFRLPLFRIRAFAAGNLTAFLGSLARGGVMFMLIIWFQGIWLPLHHYPYSETPFWAGIYMLPLMMGFLALGPVSGWLSDRWGARPIATLGMAIASGTFLALTTLPADFAYWQMGALLFIQGCGMGMFAAPNTAAIMNAVPAENRGAASGMLATLQNAGQQLSLAVFFTLVITGLSAHLASGISGPLVAAGVPPADVPILGAAISASPTASIFAAFLGANPLLFLTGALPLPQPIPPDVAGRLADPSFFPSLVAPAFMSGIDLAFWVAGGLTAVAAVVSAVRGGRYIHELHAPSAARATPPDPRKVQSVEDSPLPPVPRPSPDLPSETGGTLRPVGSFPLGDADTSPNRSGGPGSLETEVQNPSGLPDRDPPPGGKGE
jgi:MFS family permease